MLFTALKPQHRLLSHLDWLEAEAIHILREVAGQCSNRYSEPIQTYT
jgi:sulfate adenylyltransferase subunit 2